MIAFQRKRSHGPNRAVRILTAVLPYTGHVAFDIAGMQRCLVKWRIKQLNQFCFSSDQTSVHGFHRLARALGITGPADDGPALRQRIDLAFRVEMRTQGLAIIEIGAAIPITVPSVFCDILLELARLGSASFGETGVISVLR